MIAWRRKPLQNSMAAIGHDHRVAAPSGGRPSGASLRPSCPRRRRRFEVLLTGLPGVSRTMATSSNEEDEQEHRRITNTHPARAPSGWPRSSRTRSRWAEENEDAEDGAEHAALAHVNQGALHFTTAHRPEALRNTCWRRRGSRRARRSCGAMSAWPTPLAHQAPGARAMSRLAAAAPPAAAEDGLAPAQPIVSGPLSRKDTP